MASLHAVDWVLLDHTAEAPVDVGDVVSADAGGMPIYQVTALAQGKVWARDDQHPSPQLVPLERFRWRGAGTRS